MAIMPCLAFLLSILLQLVNIYCTKPLCHSEERSALLQFKQNFVIDPSASSYASSISKVASWNDNNCCMWDGVECDEVSGHVIGLELDSSYLYGFLHSNSSLFYLSHLERLNLADNHFNFSNIPSKVASLSNLVYLNLSLSSFSGEIPMDISNLSELACLDLSEKKKSPMDFSSFNWNFDLSLVDFGRFVQNLRKLEILDLSYVNMSFPLDDNIFKNLSSLSVLKIRGCDLPAVLSSLGDLTKLEYLDLAANFLSGQTQLRLGNLTELVELVLSGNNFSHGGFTWLGKQARLKRLSLCNMNLMGKIPPSLKNLTNLQALILRKNELTGQIPTWFSNLTQLIRLDLVSNKLNGPFPEFISECSNLTFLNLGGNYLSGIVRFEMFTRMKYLTTLLISGNDLRLVTNLRVNASLPNFQALGLGNCNLRMFPSLIRHQNQLLYLGLYGNKIQGYIPNWIGNVGRETLVVLDLSYNSLSGFENPLVFSLFKKLTQVNLRKNMLQGPLPFFPLSVRSLDIADNNLIGEISPCFCNLRSLFYLNLSNNNLGGIIPRCLGNFSESLAVVSLANNHFNGNILDTFGPDSRLSMVDLSHNQLGGRIPRSLANCRMLESIDLSYNQISDNFPVFFGNLPLLEIMNLRSNFLFGTLHNPTNVSGFSKLRILDVSLNELAGNIPSRFFETFSGMMDFCSDQLEYMEASLMINASGFVLEHNDYLYRVVVANKGTYMNYMKIPNSLAIIDFSSNKFQGDIPESIAILKMIKALNLSNNHLTGTIPSVFSNLKNLESLDLSSNKLSGEIPQQLTELTFLAHFDVSNNSLTGSIPHGKQFDTFENTSYLGNTELCGIPLSKKCGNLKSLVQPHHNKSSKSPIDMSWTSVAIGYGSGIVVGVVLGLVFYKRQEQWILYTFGKCQKRRSKRTLDRRIRRHRIR